MAVEASKSIVCLIYVQGELLVISGKSFAASTGPKLRGDGKMVFMNGSMKRVKIYTYNMWLIRLKMPS
jgi:hypothetical protein